MLLPEYLNCISCFSIFVRFLMTAIYLLTVSLFSSCISCADFRNKCILMSSKIIIKINPLMKSQSDYKHKS